MDTRAGERAGILLLAPEGASGSWELVEVDAAACEAVSPEGAPTCGAEFRSPTEALAAAYDVLTLMTEGRLPAMHEHVQESVREFVSVLEKKGYDRRAAVGIVIDMIERRSSLPPKAGRRSTPRQLGER